ncbi:MAG: FmdB family zinc ribbon protein [Acidobacteriota bacterium]
MPIYEYRCADCGFELEEIQKLSDPPLTTCPQCGGRLEKQLSAPAFQFKGSGWYVTDYADKGKGKGSGGAEKESKGSESSSGGDKKSESSGSSSSDSKSSSSGSSSSTASSSTGKSSSSKSD